MSGLVRLEVPIIPDSDELNLARLWSKVEVGDCWRWTGSTQGAGYGQFWYTDRLYTAHRLIRQQLVRDVIPTLDLDHLCRNRLCVNPDHLEPVTFLENLRRGESPMAKNARKVECVHGHPLTPGNVYPLRRGGKECRTCRLEYSKRQHLARKAAA
jgi:hypothetical protein